MTYALPIAILKPVQPSDAEAYASVIRAIHADEVVDPDVLRARWEEESSHPKNQARYLIVDASSVVGLAFWARPGIWVDGEPRLANVNVRMTKGHESNEVFGWILRGMEDAARAAGADLARAVTREDEPFHRRELKQHGYDVDRISRTWQLDLAKCAHSLLEARAASRQVMHDRAVDITTANVAKGDDAWKQLYELTVATIPDIPTTVTEPLPSWDSWLSTMHGPDVHEERIWTAWREGRLAGYSYLTYPAAGDVWTGYTATNKLDRDLGIGRAVKLEAIGQAIELGITSIRTNNDLDNSAIIHINETLGYAALPGMITHLKSLKR
jgi:hypothetical protein